MLQVFFIILFGKPVQGINYKGIKTYTGLLEVILAQIVLDVK